MTRYLENHYRIKHHETLPSPVYGTVHHVVFDVHEWVYGELLSEILAEGYELLSFGTTDAGEPKAVLREEDTHLGPSGPDRSNDESIEGISNGAIQGIVEYPNFFNISDGPSTPDIPDPSMPDFTITSDDRRIDLRREKRHADEQFRTLLEGLDRTARGSREPGNPLLDGIETTPTWQVPIDQEIEAYLRGFTNPCIVLPPRMFNRD